MAPPAACRVLPQAAVSGSRPGVRPRRGAGCRLRRRWRSGARRPLCSGRRPAQSARRRKERAVPPQWRAKAALPSRLQRDQSAFAAGFKGGAERERPIARGQREVAGPRRRRGNKLEIEGAGHLRPCRSGHRQPGNRACHAQNCLRRTLRPFHHPLPLYAASALFDQETRLPGKRQMFLHIAGRLFNGKTVRRYFCSVVDVASRLGNVRRERRASLRWNLGTR